jgi:hypothetical protein
MQEQQKPRSGRPKLNLSARLQAGTRGAARGGKAAKGETGMNCRCRLFWACLASLAEIASTGLKASGNSGCRSILSA